MSIIKNYVQKDEEGYVDISKSTAFTSCNSTTGAGALTFVFTNGSGTRLKLDNKLYQDIGEPEYVDIHFNESDNIIIYEGTTFKVAGGRVIYDSKLAAHIAGMASVEIQKSGSAKAGTYHLQKGDDGKDIAVISFN